MARAFWLLLIAVLPIVSHGRIFGEPRQTAKLSPVILGECFYIGLVYRLVFGIRRMGLSIVLSGRGSSLSIG